MLRTEKHSFCTRDIEAVGQLDYVPAPHVVLDGDDQGASSVNSLAISRLVTKTPAPSHPRQLKVFKVVDVV